MARRGRGGPSGSDWKVVGGHEPRTSPFFRQRVVVLPQRPRCLWGRCEYVKPRGTFGVPTRHVCSGRSVCTKGEGRRQESTVGEDTFRKDVMFIDGRGNETRVRKGRPTLDSSLRLQRTEDTSLGSL